MEGPLEATGNFGDLRDGRFHAGIDFSTQGKVGRPVYAVADGWVWRVRASGVGYGRSIYLQMRDGRFAVYGHLSRYAPSIDAYVYARQDSSGEYEQDLQPKSGELSFKRGDVIAWSGESGDGPPHLHFEVRRGDMNLHPFLFALAHPDRKAPSLAAVRIAPAAANARVAGAFDPVRVALRPGATVNGPDVRGPFTLSVDTGDWADGRETRKATYALRARVDGKLAFEAVLDSFSWDDMPEAELIYDRSVPRPAADELRALDAPPTLRSGVVRHASPAFDLVPGEHTIEIEARDEAGNATHGSVALSVERPDTPGGRRGAADPDSRHDDGTVSIRGTILYLESERDPVPSTRASIHGDLQTSDSLISSNRHVYAIAVGSGARPSGRPAAAELRNRRDMMLDMDTSVRVFRLEPMGDADSLTSSWGGRWDHEPPFMLTFDARSVFEPSAIGIRRRLLPDTSGALELIPDHLVLRRPYRVALPNLQRSRVPAEGLGLYLLRNGEWSFLASDRDSLGRFVATTRRLGTFAILADTTAPAIEPPSAYAVRADSVPPELSARITDHGSGVERKSVRVTIDGHQVPAEYQGEEQRVIWRPRTPLAPGQHFANIAAADRAGNQASVEVPFKVP